MLSSLSLALSRWSLSACSCSLHTLSPSPDLNKTSLASLSPHCCSKSRQDPSAGKGRRLNAVAVSEGGNPLPVQLFTFTQQRRRRASDPFFFAAIPSPTEPRPKNLKVYFYLLHMHCSSCMYTMNLGCGSKRKGVGESSGGK